MRRGITVVVACLATVLVTLVGVTPAQAASSSGISLSRDGVAYTPTLTDPLFGSFRIVPDDSVSRSFWVRNDAASAGYLRLTLRDVATTNVDFADALSLRADLVGWPGETVGVQSARPCSRLSEGPIIAAGSAAKVDVTASLADLDGLHGQGGTAGFTVVVSLSGEPQGLGKSGCPTTGAEVAGFPGYDTQSIRRTTSQATVFASTSEGWMPVTTSGTSTTTTTVEAGPQTPSTAPAPATRLVADANTDRFYQEWDVLLWLAALVIGGLGSVVLGRRRARTTR